MKRIAMVTLAAMAVLALWAGASQAAEKLVGISMPTKYMKRWVDDGEGMVKEFTAKGYKTILQYGDDVVENQIAQVENMIARGAAVLIIVPINGEAMTDVLEKAHAAGIKIIAYDRLLRNSDKVDCYATFDNFGVGAICGNYIVEKLDPANKGPFNLEIFAGSLDDNNAKVVYEGGMSVLQKFIDSGKLVVKSKQTSLNQVATEGWDGAKAQARMDNLLSGFYSNDKVHAVFSPYDGISIGVVSSLKGVGYTKQDMPIITGQDAEPQSVKSILAGEQTMSIFKDTRELAKRAMMMAESLLNGEKPEVNDTKSYDNGVIVVPTFLVPPVPFDATNWKKILVDSGYYTAAEIEG